MLVNTVYKVVLVNKLYKVVLNHLFLAVYVFINDAVRVLSNPGVAGRRSYDLCTEQSALCEVTCLLPHVLSHRGGRGSDGGE